MESYIFVLPFDLTFIILGGEAAISGGDSHLLPNPFWSPAATANFTSDHSYSSLMKTTFIFLPLTFLIPIFRHIHHLNIVIFINLFHRKFHISSPETAAEKVEALVYLLNANFHLRRKCLICIKCLKIFVLLKTR